MTVYLRQDGRGTAFTYAAVLTPQALGLLEIEFLGVEAIVAREEDTARDATSKEREILLFNNLKLYVLPEPFPVYTCMTIGVEEDSGKAYVKVDALIVPSSVDKLIRHFQSHGILAELGLLPIPSRRDDIPRYLF